MSRFYVPKENVNLNDKIIVVTGEEYHHIVDVMRLGESDKVHVFDGAGSEYHGVIRSISNHIKKLVISIDSIEKRTGDKTVEIILAQAIPKKSKMDFIVEKATELGVDVIVPVISERTIVKLKGGDLDKKQSRWSKIAIEAAKQCGRVDVPIIKKAEKFDSIVKELNNYDYILMAHLEKNTQPLKEVLKNVVRGKIIIFIGPEGDFTHDEIKSISAKGCKFVSFGSRVLKSDTAGLFALSVISYELGV